MKLRQVLVRSTNDLTPALDTLTNEGSPDLVLAFGSKVIMQDDAFFSALSTALPHSLFAGCTTAGEIHGTEVFESSCSLTAITFERSHVRLAEAKISGNEGSFESGEALGKLLPQADQGHPLAAILVFGRGTAINGSALIQGIKAQIPGDIPIAGGLAGDDGEFKKTYVLSGSGLCSDRIVAVGLYGTALSLSFGSAGGWEPFGPTRRITKCDGNVLYRLDDEPALNVYKRYLGDYAKDLPSSGLLFPFEMLSQEEQSVGLIRTILGIDEDAESLILAGSVDPNGYLRMMHSNTDRLIDGAEYAATLSSRTMEGETQSLALLVSCVGRKLVMGDRVDEEIEAVNDLLHSQIGTAPTITGFYSYGEISPDGTNTTCNLHNQTMTVTVMSENIG